MDIEVYTGLPGVGKTSAIIREMREWRDQNGQVVLFLSAEHPELTRRKNVRPGGLMGCRTPGLNFPIDHVDDTAETMRKLRALTKGALAAFDEAQYFKPEIADAWVEAAKRGIRVLVGTPSKRQIGILRKHGIRPTEITTTCNRCRSRRASTVFYEDNMTYPTHLCSGCEAEKQDEFVKSLFEDVRAADPFPGEKKTYQPFHQLDMPGWSYVRPDSGARTDLMQEAVSRCPSLQNARREAATPPRYLDLGCCSGYFCDAMAGAGFLSTGVDVTANFIEWAGRVARFKGQKIDYHQQDALRFLQECEETFDVTSTFATIQWVMTQQGYEAGVECFRLLFDKSKHLCVVEMGYTLEEIYKKRIPDRPREIDKHWVLDIMQKYGCFSRIEVHPAGANGIWRDVFVGFKEEPTSRPFPVAFEIDGVDQVSIAQQAWDDKWIGPDFEIYLKAEKPLRKAIIKGWIPKDTGAEKQEIGVMINGAEAGPSVSIAGGLFEFAFPLSIRTGEIFALGIKAERLPLEQKDTRPLAFVMTGLEME